MTKRKLAVFRELDEMYREILVELVDYGFRNSIDSFTRLKRNKYRELRERFPQLPSHYIHTVCQDASARIKSFMKLKKKRVAKTDKPEVKKVSIWLDDHLWRRVGYTRICMVKVIEEKCIEMGVPVVKVDPRGTSSTCPICSSKLMRGTKMGLFQDPYLEYTSLLRSQTNTRYVVKI